MRVAGIQHDIAWEDPAANFAALAPKIAQARAAGARLVVLPEMFACGFSLRTEQVREPKGGASTRFLVEQARANDLWICGSLPELPSGATRPFNTLVLCDPKGQTHRYRKIHPFTFAREHEHYDAGDEFLTVEVEGVRTTFFVCYDLRFADEFWQTATRTDCYVVVANWPERRRHHWSVLLQARAIENQAYVVGINRVGKGGDLDYQGDSAVIDPFGSVIAAASTDETMLLAEVSAERVADARARFPVLPDRR